ncbi:MAG: radical SAM protein [Armatimonadota bacterium]
MYELNPPAVFAHESVMADSRCRARLERVLAALAEPVEATVYADEELPGLIDGQKILADRVPMGTLDEIHDPILLFNTFRFDGRREERVEWLQDQGGNAGGHTGLSLLGYEPWAWFPANLPEDEHRHDKVCRPCWRLHFQNGCIHRCHYCAFGGLLITMTNVEEYVEHLARLIEAHPWQETYLFEDDADVLCLEPELGAVPDLIEFFGTLEDRYLILHTKSANVDWMLNLEHKGNTAIVWSIAGATQSTVLEPRTGTTEERIAAARKCQEAGYTVRYKFKPIIPVRNWREEASETIRLIFEQTNPDVISLCCFMWMPVEDMRRRLDVSLLDPQHLAAAEEATEEVKETRAKPFPEPVRAEIYEHHLSEVRKWDREVPVSLSTENWGMWKRLEGKLGTTATSYVCGCGPNSVPWRRKLECHPFETAEKCTVGKYELM